MFLTPRRTLILAAALIPVVGTACEGDDDKMSATACDAYADLQSAMFGDPAAMGAAADTFAAEAPSSISDEAEVLAHAFHASAEDPAAFETPEVSAAQQTVGDAVFEDCEATALDVSAVDYSFEDLPSEIDAGRVALRLTNDSDTGEPHELVLAQPTGDVTVADLAEMAMPDLFANAMPLAVAFVEQPGGTATTLVDLEPGEYLVICTLPVGGDLEAENADPHSAHGMVATLTVA